MEVQTLDTADPVVSAPPPPAPPPTAAPPVSTAAPTVTAEAGALPHDLQQHSSLLSSVARTLAGSAVSVSYRVDVQQHDVVTVFKDSANGQVLFQIPAQILEQLATFFDQQSGAVFDRKA